MPAAAARTLSSSATSSTTGLMAPPPSWRDGRAPLGRRRGRRGARSKPSRASWRQTSRPMPRLAPVTSATRERSVDVEDRLARDAAVEQRVDGVGRLAPARLEVDLRVQAAGGDERERAGRASPVAAAALGQLGEDEQAVDARAGGAAEERARGVLDVRARVAVGEGDDRAVGRDALDRGAERRRRRRPRRSTSKLGPSGVSSWMTSSAPRSVRPRARSGLAETAVTWAPPMCGELDGEAPDAAAARR